MTHTSPSRPRAAGLVALVAAGALLLGATPALAQDAAPDSPSSTRWSPNTPALIPWPKDVPYPDYRQYYNAALPSEQVISTDFLASGIPEDYTFTMQDDGNAVLRTMDGTVLFDTGTFNVDPGPTYKNRLVMQPDGNLVVYSPDERPLWSSGTDDEPGAHLVLGEDGDLVLYRQNGTPAWSAAAGRIAEPPTATLAAGGTLLYGHQLTSENGLFRAVLQRDGNLVGYGPSGVVWSTGTRGLGNRLALQNDGNVVVYGADGSVRWATGTSGEGSTLALDDSGGLKVVSSDGDIQWDSQAALPGSVAYAPNYLDADSLLRSDDGAYRAVMQADGNFVVYGPTGAVWWTGTSGIDSSFEISENGVAQVVAGNGAVTWRETPTAGAVGPFRFVMQNDGNLVEYDGQGRAVWHSR